MPRSGPAPRRVRLFHENRNRAIRIPVGFGLPGDGAMASRDGGRLIIAPVRKGGLAALLDRRGPLDEESPVIHDPPPAQEDVF